MKDYTYFPYNYLHTPLNEFTFNYEKLDEHGILPKELSNYRKRMEDDRERWRKRCDSLDIWKLLLLFLLAALIFFCFFILKHWLCDLLEIYEEDSFGNYFFTFLSVVLIIFFEWLLFSSFNSIFDSLSEKIFMRNVKKDILIEKYLEIAHFEWYKINKFEDYNRELISNK